MRNIWCSMSTHCASKKKGTIHFKSSALAGWYSTIRYKSVRCVVLFANSYEQCPYFTVSKHFEYFWMVKVRFKCVPSVECLKKNQRTPLVSRNISGQLAHKLNVGYTSPNINHRPLLFSYTVLESSQLIIFPQRLYIEMQTKTYLLFCRIKIAFVDV